MPFLLGSLSIFIVLIINLCEHSQNFIFILASLLNIRHLSSTVLFPQDLDWAHLKLDLSSLYHCLLIHLPLDLTTASFILQVPSSQPHRGSWTQEARAGVGVPIQPVTESCQRPVMGTLRVLVLLQNQPIGLDDIPLHLDGWQRSPEWTSLSFFP